MWARLQNLPGRLNAIDPWHLQIHQNHIRLQRGCQFNHLLASGRFPDDLGVNCGREQCAHALAEERMIVCDQNAERIHQLTPSLREDAPGCACHDLALTPPGMTHLILLLVRAWRAVRRQHRIEQGIPRHHR